MAGRNAGFNAGAFRQGVRFAMNMGAPPDADAQATFFFPEQRTAEGSVDADRVPFDPSQRITTTRRDPVKVPCAIEYFDREGNVTALGQVLPSRAVVTLLDEEYSQVKGCSYVAIGGERFLYRHEEIPRGLFDVGLHTLHFVNENDL